MERQPRNLGNVEDGPSASSFAVNNNRDEDSLLVTSVASVKKTYEDDGSKPKGRSSLDQRSMKTRDRVLRLATWNVRTLLQPGKFDNLIQEMSHLNIDIMGLSEVRWKDAGSLTKNGYTLIYSGGKKHERGVGIIMKQEISKSISGYWAVNDRIILVKLAARPFNIAVVQAYAPTSDHSDEEIEFYHHLQNTIDQVKSQDVLIVTGDFNANVGKGSYLDIVGNHGLGQRNERGEQLIDFCLQNNFIIANTLFQHHPRHLYTWKNPDDSTRNQIDYIMIKRRFRNSIIQTKTYPGADIDSDHNPIVAKIKLKLKKLSAPQLRSSSSSLNKNFLKNATLKNMFTIELKNRFEALTNLDEDCSQNEEKIEHDWTEFKRTIHEAKDKMPSQNKNRHKPWMKDEILQLMRLRKKFKNKPAEYKYLSKTIKQKCRKEKEDWLNSQCEEIENLAKTNNNYELFRKINKFTGNNKNYSANRCIKDLDGKMLLEKEEVKKRWLNYISNLYKGNKIREPTFTREGPPITKDEIIHAVRKMKTGTTPGPDNILIEFLKTEEDGMINALTALFNRIYQSGYIPEELCKSVLVNLPKKPMATDCNDYRQISLISHITKILLKIILGRIHSKIVIEDTQSGFQKDKGTREGIFNLRMIIERSLEMNRQVHLCFIDYTKAFDSIDHQTLLFLLEKSAIDGKDLRIITNLYKNQQTAVLINQELTDYFHIEKGVRQGCVLSPLLFNLYSEEIFKNLDTYKGIKINGRNINNLRYADDTVLIGETKAELQNILNEVTARSEKVGLKINAEKTKTMIISREKFPPSLNISLNNNSIEQVNSFIYLGQQITPNGKCDNEVKRRIAIAKTNFQKRKKLFTSKELSLKTRLRLIKCYIWSVALYGSETWTINKSISKRLEAFEMWLLRRMLKVSWTEKKTNSEVLSLANTGRSLMNHLKNKKLRYFGHLIRKEDLQKLVLEGKIEGRRQRGRQRLHWFDNIKEWTGMTYGECVRLAKNRKEWRSMVADLRGGDGT